MAAKRSLTDTEAWGIAEKILLIYRDLEPHNKNNCWAFGQSGLLVEVFGQQSQYSDEAQLKVKNLLANYVKKNKNANPNLARHFIQATYYRRDQLIPDPL